MCYLQCLNVFNVSYIGQQHLNPDSIYICTQWSDKRHKQRVYRLLYIQKTWRIKKLYKLYIWTENKWIFSSLASSCCIFRILFPFPARWVLSKRLLSSKPFEPSKIVLQFRNGEKQTLQIKLSGPQYCWLFAVLLLMLWPRECWGNLWVKITGNQF